MNIRWTRRVARRRKADQFLAWQFSSRVPSADVGVFVESHHRRPLSAYERGHESNPANALVRHASVVYGSVHLLTWVTMFFVTPLLWGRGCCATLAPFLARITHSRPKPQAQLNDRFVP